MPAKKAYVPPNQAGGRGPGGPPGRTPTLQPPRQGAPIGGRPGGGGYPIEPPGWTGEPPPGTPPWAGPGGGMPPKAWPPPGAEVPPVIPPGFGGGGGMKPGFLPGGGGPLNPAAIRAALAAKLAASGAGAPLSTPDPLQAALLKLKLGGGL